MHERSKMEPLLQKIEDKLYMVLIYLDKSYVRDYQLELEVCINKERIITGVYGNVIENIYGGVSTIMMRICRETKDFSIKIGGH